MKEPKGRKYNWRTMFGLISRVELAFCREPTAVDFQRWIKHSSRIRRIDTRLSSPCKLQYIAFDVYYLLQAHCSEYPMVYLPPLNSLSYNEKMFADECNVVFPASFHFSPTLKAVTLVLAARSDLNRLEELIHSLSWLVTYADRLTFCSASADCWLSLPVMRTWRLHSLTSFTGRRVSVEFEDLLSLGELPHLRKLDIETRTERNEYRALPRSRQAWFFPALQDLKLHAKEANPGCCIAFLGAVTPAWLHSVFIELRWPRDSAAAGLFTDLCTALAGLPCPDTIQYVTISLPVGDDVDDEGNLFPSPCLEPLLSLHSLRSLRVLGGCKVVVENAMLDRISLAWPVIRILLFEWPHRPPASLRSPWDLLMDEEAYEAAAADAHDLPRATLAGLVPLALRWRICGWRSTCAGACRLQEETD